MARLIDALIGLVPAAELLVGRRVVSLEPRTAEHGPRVTLDDGTVLAPDAVVLAVPAHVAAPLLADVAPEAATVVSAIEHSSVAMLTLAFDRPDLGDVSGASGCLVPRDQGTVMSAASFATSKWAQLRDPERDDVILRVSAGRVGDDRQLDLDDDALLAAILADLDRVVGVRGAPTEVRIGRWTASLPQYAPGHLARIDAVEAALAGTGVVAAGMWLRGVGIPASIRSADLAVEQILG
jgi:oxygen-dependent protoporphyrinogen oxidase